MASSVLNALRRAGAHSRVEPWVAHAIRSRVVKPSVPFFVGEARGRGGRDYVVRTNGVRVHVEHGTTDAATLDQAFVQDVYEPSAAAAARLDALGRPPVVLDLGANVGMFGLWAAARWPGARITAAEPVPRNLALLRRNFAMLPNGTTEVVAAAVATRDGEVTFGGGAFTNGRILEGGDGLTVASRDVFALTDGVDLLKLDIEGGEWPILADERFAAQGAPVVMLEYHPMGAPVGIDPEQSASQALSDAGYVVERTVTEGPGAGILWGVRDARASGRSA